jgi:hypothetical protein
MTAMETALDGGTTTAEEIQSFEAPGTEDISYTPPVEEPVVADEPVVGAVEETVVEAPKTIEVEKIVEKIVEKHPEFKNEKSKALFEQLTNAEDSKVAEKTVLEYLREKNRDYSVMSDIDVVKASIRKENPTWTKDQVDLKMRRTYGKDLTPINLASIDQDIDPDKYEQAQAHNEKVSDALEGIQLDALQKRPLLIQQQSELELPQIKPMQSEAPSGPTPEQVDAANKVWKETVDASIGGFTEIKQTIDNKEVVYGLTDEDKAAIRTEVENFNLLQFSKDRGWQNEDGTPNILKLAEDMLKLKNFDKISKSFGTQSKTEATKDVLKSIKNIEDVKRPSQENTAPTSLEDAYYKAMDGML